MLWNIAQTDIGRRIAILAGLFFGFALTALLTAKLRGRLPRDAGRDYAVDGKKSAGKPRGAGILFVLAFAATAVLFLPMRIKYALYLVLLIVCMLTGFLDDAAKKPWGELRKGLLDLLVASLVTGIYLHTHGGNTAVTFALLHRDVRLPFPLFVLLSVALIWGSVNVTNCSDGVDGLSGTLTIVSLLGIYGVTSALGSEPNYAVQIPVFIACLLAYLWFNAAPSAVLMGDAGSRAMGLFLAISALESGAPFLFLLLAAALILDGGLGLVKVTLIRVCKIHIFKNTRMPLHDHVRKALGWSNTQCVFRFALIQALIVLAVLTMV